MSQIGDLPASSEADANSIVPDAAGARWLRRHLAGGVVITTTFKGDEFKGSTMSAVLCVSEQPLLVLISLEEDSQLHEWLEASGSFALSFLPWREQFLADQFAGFTPRASRRFEGIDYFVPGTGAPVLRAAIAWADCRIEQTLDTGDHRCYIGCAVSIGQGDGREDDPLIHYVSRYRRLT